MPKSYGRFRLLSARDSRLRLRISAWQCQATGYLLQGLLMLMRRRVCGNCEFLRSSGGGTISILIRAQASGNKSLSSAGRRSIHIHLQ